MLVHTPADVGVTAQGAYAGTGRIYQNRIVAIGRKRAEVGSVLHEHLVLLYGSFFQMLFTFARALRIHVQRVEGDLLAETVKGDVLQHNGLRASACANLQEPFGLLLGHGQGRGALGRHIRDNKGSLRKQARNQLVGNRFALSEAERRNCAGQVDHLGNRDHLHMALHQRRKRLRPIDAGKVEHEEQRRRLVGTLHETQRLLAAKICGKTLCQPNREALLHGRSLHVFRRIAEREGLLQLDGAMQREVGQARCLRRNRAHQLYTLVCDYMVGLAQVEQLAKRHAQGIADVGLDVLRVVEHRIDKLIERSLS